MQNVCRLWGRLGVDRDYGTLTIIVLSVKSPRETFALSSFLKSPKSEEPLLDQLGNICTVDAMAAGMAENDLVRFVLKSQSLTTLLPFPSCLAMN